MALREKHSILERLPLRYQPTEVLSERERSCTLKALDTGLRHGLAVLKCQELSPDGAVGNQSFVEYCTTLSSLRNPFVAALYTWGVYDQDDGTKVGYTTRGFVDGHPLSEFELPLERGSLVRVVGQICQGLHALHSKNLQHGDVKPENIIVRRSDGRTIDGLSQCVLIDLVCRSSTNWENGEVDEVSLQYLAPEVFEGKCGDVRSDLYGLGALLYRLATGEVPFGAKSLSGLLRAKRDREIRDAPDADRALLEVATRLMDPHPENRLQSASAVIAGLEQRVTERVRDPYTVLDQSAAPVVAGRSREIERCVAWVEKVRRAPGSGAIEITGASGYGVSTFLRELQDRSESSGATILTARPRLIAGYSIQEQLAGSIQRLVRPSRARPARADSRCGEQRTESSAELLDDLHIAVESAHLVLFVDDWHLCSTSELQFLRRVLLQMGAQASSLSRARGRFQLALGTTSDSSEAWGRLTAGNQIERTSISLGRWTLADLEEFLESALPSLGIAAADKRRILDACTGNPRAIVSVIDANLGEPCVDWKRVCSRTQSESVDELAYCRREIEAVSRRPLGLARLALGLWGVEAPADVWPSLVAELHNCAPASELRVAGRIASAGAFEGRGHCEFGHLAPHIKRCLRPDQFARVERAVVTAMRSTLRSSDRRVLSGGLMGLVRLGKLPASLIWRVIRALLILLESGRLGEVEYCAAEMAEFSSGWAVKWLRLFARAARVDAGRELTRLSDGGNELEGLAGGYAQWIEGRALLRARFAGEAWGRFRALIRSHSMRPGIERSWVRFLRDYATAAANLKMSTTVRACERNVLKRLVDLGVVVARHRLMNVKFAHGHAARDASRLAEYYRIRFRRLDAHSCSKRATSSVEKERRLRRASGSKTQEAACLNNLGILWFGLGRSAAATESFEACASARKKLDDERGLVAALNNLALAAASAGDFSRAVSALHRARIVAIRNGLLRHRALVTLNLGVAYGKSGQLRAARRAFARLIREAQETGDYSTRLRATFNHTHVALDCVHFESARRWIEKLRVDAAENAGIVKELELWALEAEYAVRIRNWDALEDCLGRLGPAEKQSHGVEIETYRLLLQSHRGGTVRDSSMHMAGSAEKAERLRYLCHRWSALGRQVSTGSLWRLLRAARRSGSPRVALEWAVLGFGADARVDEQRIRHVWQVLGWPETSQGHDDAQIRLRALIAAHLRRRGRVREAWKLLEQAVERFARLERILRDSDDAQNLVAELQLKLEDALNPAVGAHRWAMLERSRTVAAMAFFSLLDRRKSDRLNAATADAEVLRQLAAATDTQFQADCRLRKLLRVCTEACGAERAMIIGAESGTPTVLSAIHSYDSSKRDEAKGISWAVVSKVLSAGQPLRFEDALSSEELAGHRSVATFKIRSLACVPVKDGDAVVGVLYLDHQGVAGLFGERDLELLAIVANIVAGTLTVAESRSRAIAQEEQLGVAHRQLLRTERSRLAGELAGGIVHDLKNVMTAIVARCQMIAVQRDPDTAARSLSAIESAALSGARLLEQLQECSREHSTRDREPVDVAAVVSEALELVEPRMMHEDGCGERKIAAHVSREGEYWVLAHRGEIREVFLNLFLNACDAMPEGGTLSVRFKRTADESACLFEVEDTGIGMQADVQDRIFEPFFTTKSRSGTGLGLAVVRNAIVRHAGKIDVFSTPDVGTTFRISLPLIRNRVVPESEQDRVKMS